MVGQVAARRAAGVILEMIKVIIIMLAAVFLRLNDVHEIIIIVFTRCVSEMVCQY